MQVHGHGLIDIPIGLKIAQWHFDNQITLGDSSAVGTSEGPQGWSQIPVCLAMFWCGLGELHFDFLLNIPVYQPVAFTFMTQQYFTVYRPPPHPQLSIK